MARKILIADDEEDFLEILSYNLRNEGFEVVAVTDGQAALHALSRGQARTNLEIGDLILHLENYRITLHRQHIGFTKTELNLLAFLVQCPNKIHCRELLLSNVWGEDTFVVDRTVDVHVGKIRKKLGDSGDFIETKPGGGCRFNTQRVGHADQT